MIHLLYKLKIKYNKDKFKLYETLTGEPIDCWNCQYYYVGRTRHTNKCKPPLTYYHHSKKTKAGEEVTELLSFCENYQKENME